MTKAQPLGLKNTIRTNARPKFSEKILVSGNLQLRVLHQSSPRFHMVMDISYIPDFKTGKTCFATEKRENASEMCNHPI